MIFRTTISTLLTLVLVAALSSCGSSHNTHLVYVSTGQGIYGFRVDQDGNANELPSDPFIVGNTPSGMVIASSGQRGYVANQSDNSISRITIDPRSGVISEVQPRTSIGGFAPNQLLLDSSGSTLFSANLLSNNISTFSVAGDGALTLKGTTSLPDTPSNLAFANNLLFVSVPNVKGVYIFGLSGGSLNAMSGSPLVVPVGVGTVTVDSSAKFLYVTNPSNNTISGYSIQASANSITLSQIAGSPFASTNAASTSTATAPISAILDSTGTHLYVANAGSANIDQFSVGTDGSLTSFGSTLASVGANPRLLIFDPISKHLLVGCLGSKSVSQLTVGSDATLTAGQTISLQSVPQAIAVTH